MGREHDEKLMHANRIKLAKEKGWCVQCGGTGFISYWKVTDATRKMFGEEGQEFSTTCPYCFGKGKV